MTSIKSKCESKDTLPKPSKSGTNSEAQHRPFIHNHEKNEGGASMDSTNLHKVQKLEDKTQLLLPDIQNPHSYVSKTTSKKPTLIIFTGQRQPWGARRDPTRGHLRFPHRQARRSGPVPVLHGVDGNDHFGTGNNDAVFLDLIS